MKDEDWECVKDLSRILKPFKVATLEASKSGNSLVITNVIPLYHYATESLKKFMENFQRTDDIYIGMSVAYDKLIHYYDQVSPMVGIALLLDPTYKKSSLKDMFDWKEEWIDAVEESFVDAFRVYKSKVDSFENIEPPSSNEDNDYASFRRQKKRKGAAGVMVREEEYTRYENGELAPLKTDILSFWKINCFNYPVLSSMAKDYLTVQASSVPAERAFSSGTDLITADRCSLAGKTIEMAQFLKFSL